MATRNHNTPRISDEGATIESIAYYLGRRNQERRQVEEATGWQFIGDELLPRKLTTIACTVSGCLMTVAGSSEAEAFQKLENHLVNRHGIQAPGQVA